jgi:hypothetical protein
MRSFSHIAKPSDSQTAANRDSLFFQAKLSIYNHGGQFEQEANNADKAIQSKSNVLPVKTGMVPFVSPAPVRATTATVPLQRTCTNCDEKENKLQRKQGEEEEEELLPGAAPSLLQTKLTIGKPDDAYEQEADTVAEKVMRMQQPIVQRRSLSISSIQRKCTHCEEDDKKIQRKGGDAQNSLAENTLGNYVNSLSSGGNPLPQDVRNFYEPRFGYDFSNVKVHTDAVAAKSAQSIDALAYTTGNNIVFSNGQYSPTTDSGKRLLGHELTHVIQQTGSSSIRPKRMDLTSNFIQRAYWIGANANGSPVTGTQVHNDVLNDIGSSKPNSDLFTEAPIPNADLHSAGFDKIGVADFYKASTTIGVTFPKFHIPDYLKSPPRLLLGGKKYSHIKLASPTYRSSQINLDKAPTEILIGDLKPYGAEELDPKYEEQVSNYIEGIGLASDQINKMAVYPDERVRRFIKDQKTWSPKVKEMSYGSLQIPDDYKIGSTDGRRWRIVLKEGMDKYFVNERMYGRLYIAYRKDQKGIWNYIWAPEGPVDLTAIPQNVLDLQVNLEAITLPLQNARLQAKRNKNGNQNSSILQRTPTGKKAPEKKDSFKLDEWETKLKNFQQQVKGLPDKDIKSANARVKAYKTQQDLSSKFHGIPSPTEKKDDKQKIKTVKQIRFWSHPLAKHIGKFRKAFGTVFAKGYSAVEYIKEKVTALLGSSKTGGSGGLIGAVIKLFFRIFKIAGKFLFRKTIDLILGSLMKGFAKKMEAFLDDLIPDEVEAQIEKIKKIQAEYEASAVAEVTELIEKLAGPYMDVIEMIKEIESKARKMETIIDLVRWGARIIACASPPAIGCLWNIAQAIIERLAAKVVESCWFTKKVGSRVAGALTAFDTIRNIPVSAAGFIIEKINSLMPKGWEKTFPIPEKSSLDAIRPEYDGTCDEGTGSGSSSAEEFDATRQEIFNTVEEVGGQRFGALLQMMNAKGKGPWVMLTIERIQKIKEDLKKTSPDDMQKIARGEKPAEPLPKSLEDLNSEITTYTAGERKAQSQHQAGQKAKKDAQLQALIDKAMKLPYPPFSELTALMAKYNWPQLGFGQADYVYVNSRVIIFVKTNNGAHIAAFTKHFEQKIKDQSHIAIAAVSEFITMDEVQPGDGFAVKAKGDGGIPLFSFEEFDISKPVPSGSKLKAGDNFIGVYMPVK